MPRTVMVVNDTQEILDLFRELLTEEGYDVVLSSFAPHELDEIERIMPDLLILDMIIGREETGWQLLQKLKMHRPTANIPVIVCTAAKRLIEDIEGHLVQMGVGVVLKPFVVDHLLDAIEKTLQNSPHAADNQDHIE